MTNKPPMMIIGIPITAPISVTLMITPTIINTNPKITAIKRPVKPTIRAIKRHNAQKGQRNQATFFEPLSDGI